MWGTHRGNKYGNKKITRKVEIDGELKEVTFDSLLESALFDLLSLRAKSGEITNLAHHPGTIFLSPARIQYRPDFRFTIYKTGETKYAESKGQPTPKWALQKKLWRWFGPEELEIWMGSARRLVMTEKIIPKNEICSVCGK